MCNKVHDCKHPCNGFATETVCMPCLDPACVKKNEAATYSVDHESPCTICLDCLGQGPCVQFECKHIFHVDCIKTKIDMKWQPGKHISFAFMECPACNQILKNEHPPKEIADNLREGERLLKIVRVKAVERAKFEGLDKDERLEKEGDPFFGKLEDLAMHKLTFYECFTCKVPYYGGMRDCAEAMRQEEEEKLPLPEDLKCSWCHSVGKGAGKTVCEVHGEDSIEYKCKYCCKTALWHCWGTTHFCEPCHDRCDYVVHPCSISECPLEGCHPPNGEEYAIGCS